MKYAILNWLKKLAVALVIIVLFSLPVVQPPRMQYPVLKESEIPDSVFVVFRNDDISYYSDLRSEFRFLELFRKFDSRPIFAIIPNPNYAHFFYENKPLTDSLIHWYKNGSIRPAMHGFTHNFNKMGEFKRLPFQDQDSLMKIASKAFTSVFKTDILFCPPWNQLDNNTIAAGLANNIRRFSGFRGIPVHDSIVAFNANMNLFEGDLPAIGSILNPANALKNTIIVILYHSSYEFRTTKNLAMLENTLESLKRVYHVDFSDMDYLITRYPEYLRFTNILGLNYYVCRRYLNMIRYFGVPTFRLQMECENNYNLIFKGEPVQASNNLKSLLQKLSLLLLSGLTCIGLVIVLLISVILRFLRLDKKTGKSKYYIAGLFLALAGIILQITLLADRPKWQLIAQLIIYVLLAIGIIRIFTLWQKKLRID